MDIETSVNFLLSHFEESSLFPRKMMTRCKKYQFTVYDKKEIIQRCIDSDFTDCRINAYPEFTKWEKHDMVRYPPNFIFVDLDLSTFQKYKDPKKMLDKTLQTTLNKISQSFSTEHPQHTQHTPVKNETNIQQKNYAMTNVTIPTVLWSGNGYHIYIPISAIVLDQEDIFSKDRFPNLFSLSGKYSNWSVSEVFLKFAEIFFTRGRADPQHSPKYKTCLIRVPDALNSKCRSRGSSDEESKVKIIQRWNGYRPPIQLLIKEFRRWLVQEEINQKIQNRKIRNTQLIKFGDTSNFQIQWIERLLQTGVPDGRKETLRLILGPYISKRYTHDRSIRILQNWIEKCDKVNPLDPGFNSRQRIRNSVKNTKGFLNIDNLRIKYPWLWNVIQTRINAN